ncbi:hypothetical protein DPMN_085182 [Dreissena polymorpha]|uniref:Uncharacterized protein n=1 Tax=Dreissena polymorpha TaxID=45954 RepID=A0A9D3YF82_DREPO|nr:hypothetical protein DPMN_085182 [Dreissena polymorpha]
MPSSQLKKKDNDVEDCDYDNDVEDYDYDNDVEDYDYDNDVEDYDCDNGDDVDDDENDEVHDDDHHHDDHDIYCACLIADITKMYDTTPINERGGCCVMRVIGDCGGYEQENYIRTAAAGRLQ